MSEPVKGRLKLPGQEVDIPFTLAADKPDRYVGCVANTKITNIFYKLSGWIFEADKPTLAELIEPLEAGTIVRIKHAQFSDEKGAIWLRTLKGVQCLNMSGEHMAYTWPVKGWEKANAFTVEIVAVLS